MSLVSLLALLPTALAMPAYDDAGSSTGGLDCRIAQGNWDAVQVDDRLHVYLSDTFTADLNTTITQSMSQAQAEQQVQAAMEVWNRESTGPVVLWGGATTADMSTRKKLGNATCEEFADGIDLPAVIVDALQVNAGAGNGTPLEQSDGTQCSDLGYATGAATNRGMAGDANVMHLMVHELGHVLGLGHAFAGPASQAANGPMATMSRGGKISDFNTDAGRNESNDTRRRHLWPYDIDCVDDDLDAAVGSQEDARKRQLTYRSRAYTPDGNTWSLPVDHDAYVTGKGSVAAGMVPDPDGGIYPLAYDAVDATPWLTGADSSIEVGSAADGVVDLEEIWALHWVVGSWYSALSPTLGGAPEHESTHAYTLSFAQPHRYAAGALGGGQDDVDVSRNDPPVAMQASHAQFGGFTSEQALLECTDTACDPASNPDDPALAADSTMIKSHTPLRQAWDPIEQQTVFASVRTRDCNDAAGTDRETMACGSILIYPGYGDGMSTTLARGEVVDLSVTLPARTVGVENNLENPTGYDGRTHMGVGLTCADQAVTGDHNCMVAWVDTGSLDSRILVTYFHVDGTDVVWDEQAQELTPSTVRLWDDGAVQDDWGRVVGGALELLPQVTASDVTAAYVDGRFFVAYKYSEAPYIGHVAYSQTQKNHLDNWTMANILEHESTVEAPWFAFDPTEDQAEAALVWTVLAD